jgi:hypothetical protein
MADSTGSLSLFALLTKLLAHHAEEETAFEKEEERWFKKYYLAVRRQLNASQKRQLTSEVQKWKARTGEARSQQHEPLWALRDGMSDFLKSVPSEVCESIFERTPSLPPWEQTPWEVAVRELAKRSAFFHSIESEDSDPIDMYEQLLRHYLTDAKRGGPTRSNKAAAELLEFEKQGLVAELFQKLKSEFPTLTLLKHLSPSKRAEGSGQRKIEALEKRVHSIDRRTRKQKSPAEKLREQRNKFSRPRRQKGQTWNKIYLAYHAKYPRDTTASRHTLRQSLDRNRLSAP